MVTIPVIEEVSKTLFPRVTISKLLSFTMDTWISEEGKFLRFISLEIGNHEVVIGFYEGVVGETGGMSGFYFGVFVVPIVCQLCILAFNISLKSEGCASLLNNYRYGYKIHLSPVVLRPKFLDFRIELS